MLTFYSICLVCFCTSVPESNKTDQFELQLQLNFNFIDYNIKLLNACI